MANVQFQNATVLRRVEVGKVQTAENVRISVKNDIAEVYSTGVENYINSYDASDGEVTFYGKTSIKFLYNDGATVAGSSYNADFTASISDSRVSPESKFCFDVATVDTKVDTNANTAMLTVLLEITVYTYVRETAVYFADSDDCFVKKEGLEVLENADVLNLPLVIDEQLSATKTIDTVCLAESSICICDYTLAENVLRVTGEATVRLTYLSEGNLTCDALPFKFDSELDAAEIPANAQLCIKPVVRGTKVRLDIAEDSVNTDFTAEISVFLCTECCTTGVLEAVSDAYGSCCDFDFSRQNVSTTLPCGCTAVKKKISGTLPVSGGKNLVAAVNVGATVTQCTSQEKCARIEGVVYATAVTKTESGWAAEPLELPFVQTVEVSYLAPQCGCYANVAVTYFSVEDSGGLSASAELCVSVFGLRDVSYSLICAADEKTFDKRELPAIEVCLAHKGETLWSLAKGLHMSEEDLIAVNPEISNPLEKDARIVVFNKI